MKKNKVLILFFLIIFSIYIVSCMHTEDMTYDKTKYTTQLQSESIEPLQSCYYGGSNEIVYENPKDIINFLDEQGNCEAVTIPIAWCFVEQEEQSWDFSLYEPIFDEIVANDYKLIIILDAGGRSILKNGEVVARSIPDWVWSKYPSSAAVDFDGNITSTFDYFSTEQIVAINSFYNQTIGWIEKYREHVVAISPGIMGECEIKYSQEGFRWQSYSDAAKASFCSFLSEKYETVERMNDEFGTSYSSFKEIELPIINYNNTIVSPNVSETFLYTEWMECRENQIVKYITNFVDVIRERGYKTIGYFGQFMYPIDSIYATGVVTKCTELFDIAVIDYNFYDGYKTVYNEYIPAYLTNLVSNLGYETVYTGLYFERMSLDGQQEFVTNVTNNIQKDGHSSGIETGSVTNNTEQKIVFSNPQSINKEKSKVAIYTSEWNYYKTHGESEDYLDYLSDGSIELYRILQFELNIPVEIVTDTNIENGDLNNYELIFLPSQMFVAEDTQMAIELYVKNGGKAIQDIRFGEYDSYGRLDGSVNRLFGIEMQCGYAKKLTLNPLVSGMKRLKVNKIYSDIPSYYEYISVNEAEYLFNTKQNQYVGVLTENTLTWGFQPQLLYKQTGDEKYIEFINESILMLVE